MMNERGGAGGSTWDRERQSIKEREGGMTGEEEEQRKTFLLLLDKFEEF